MSSDVAVIEHIDLTVLFTLRTTSYDTGRCRTMSSDVAVIEHIDLTVLFTYSTTSYFAATTLTQKLNLVQFLLKLNQVQFLRQLSQGVVWHRANIVQCCAQCEHRLRHAVDQSSVSANHWWTQSHTVHWSRSITACHPAQITPHTATINSVTTTAVTHRKHTQTNISICYRNDAKIQTVVATTQHQPQPYIPYTQMTSIFPSKLPCWLGSDISNPFNQPFLGLAHFHNAQTWADNGVYWASRAVCAIVYTQDKKNSSHTPAIVHCKLRSWQLPA